MVKINKNYHKTKSGVVKKNPFSLSKEIKGLIKIKNKVTRSDLQGLVDVIGMKIAPSDWQLQSEISDRILVIIDNSDNFTSKQLDYHIERLRIDIKNYRG